MSDTFLTNVDTESMNEVFTSTEDNVQYFTDISDTLVKSYTSDMDTLMSDLYTDCIKNDASDMILEKYLLELNNMLYFLGSKLETIGIKEDLSKLASKESYNNAYLRNRLKDGTRQLQGCGRPNRCAARFGHSTNLLDWPCLHSLERCAREGRQAKRRTRIS